MISNGMDFADALPSAGSSHCAALFDFDDRRFARRARRIAKTTRVIVPNERTTTETKDR